MLVAVFLYFSSVKVFACTEKTRSLLACKQYNLKFPFLSQIFPQLREMRCIEEQTSGFISPFELQVRHTPADPRL